MGEDNEIVFLNSSYYCNAVIKLCKVSSAALIIHIAFFYSKTQLKVIQYHCLQQNYGCVTINPVTAINQISYITNINNHELCNLELHLFVAHQDSYRGNTFITTGHHCPQSFSYKRYLKTANLSLNCFQTSASLCPSKYPD